jgi:hypothetical protein
MADQQALNATFFAFKKRDRGGVLLAATAAYIVLLLVVFGGFVLVNAAAVVDYFNWISALQTSGATSPEQMMMPPESVMAIGPTYLLLQIVFYIIVASYEAACLRWMIHGETGGFFGLTLGADTWRVYFTYWIWLFLFIAYGIILLVALGGFGAALGFSAAQGDSSQMGSGFIAMALVFCLWLLGMIYFGVRFAPAAATSVARRRFAFFEAWTVTKGRFWALLGSFVLLILMYVVGYVIFSTLATFALIGGMMSQVQGMGSEPTPEAMYALFANPAVAVPLGVTILVAVIGSLVWTIALIGVNARAAQAALEDGKIQAAA